MKKIIALLFAAAFLLTGCKVKTYTPEIADFNQNATVTAGDFSYTCEISKQGMVVTVMATSTNASGMSIVYNGTSAVFKYLDMEYEIVSDKIDDTNPAKAVYDAFEVLISGVPDNASKTADGFRYDGKTALGDFILLQNDDYSYKSIYFKEANMNIVFE
ncbi:MAG: hypothetical protein K2L36_00795 [Eubacterium sp.]|nr:hypothetical protein [Eubacterium sp.]